VASFYLCSRISDVFEKLVGVAGRLDNAEVLVLLNGRAGGQRPKVLGMLPTTKRGSECSLPVAIVVR
jgi:hypothetical protein